MGFAQGDIESYLRDVKLRDDTGDGVCVGEV